MAECNGFNSAMTEFYINNCVSPVRQNIDDLKIHFEKREALYRQLGILPAFINNRSVLEVGPGSGFNSLYTASLKPSKYVLVEGNPSGVRDIETLLKKYDWFRDNLIIEPVFLEDYKADEKFDFVLCEGVLGALGSDSGKLLIDLTKYLKPGGVLVITCSDDVGYLPEALRRLLAVMLTKPDESLECKTKKMVPVFGPHLAKLPGVSKICDDWLIDNLFNPASIDVLFPLDHAVLTLPDGFEVYASSPNIITDWRWYKQIYGNNKNYNNNAVDQYRLNIHNLIDYRIITPTPSDNCDFGLQLRKSCSDVRQLIKGYEQTRSEDILLHILDGLELIIAEVDSFSIDTAEALREAYSFISNKPLDIHAITNSVKFGSLFGRSQQYLSISRRV